MKIKEFLKEIFEHTKSNIVDCINSQLDNVEKKSLVDSTITDWVNENIIKLSPVQRVIIAKWLIPVIPTFTQLIYDCLKQKVEGLTLNG